MFRKTFRSVPKIKGINGCDDKSISKLREDHICHINNYDTKRLDFVTLTRLNYPLEDENWN